MSSDEEIASGESQSQGSSHGDSDASAGTFDEPMPHFKWYTPAKYCGRIFTRKSAGEVKYICLHERSKGRCQRKHGKLKLAEVPGYYQLFKTRKSPARCDGLYDEFLTEQAYKTRKKRESQERDKLMEDVARKNRIKSSPSPKKFPPSSNDPDIFEKAEAIRSKIDPETEGITKEAEEILKKFAAREERQEAASKGAGERKGRSVAFGEVEEFEDLEARRKQEDGELATIILDQPMDRIQNLEKPKQNRPASRSRESINVETVTSDEEDEPPMPDLQPRRARKERPPPSQRGLNDDDPNSDAEERRDHRERRRSHRNKKKGSRKVYYAACRGSSRYPYGVFKTKREQQKAYKSNRDAERKNFYSQSEAWRWIDRTHRDFDSDSDSECSSDSSYHSYESDSSFSDHSRRSNTVRKESGGIPPSKRSERTKAAVREPNRLPVELSGRDPSTKKRDELFGISTGRVTSTNLLAKMSPPGVSSKCHENLSDGMIDALSLPGKTQSYDVDDSELALGDAFGELAHQMERRRRYGGEARKDLKWKHESQTSLKSVKNLKELQRLYQEVMATKDDSLDEVSTVHKAILARQPWSQDTIDLWADSGYMFRICKDSANNYIGLISHLVLLATTVSWGEAKVEIDFYVREFGLLRARSTSRFLFLCRAHIMLRDGADQRWRSAKLQDQRILDLTKTVSEIKSGDDETATLSAITNTDNWICKKCGTGCIHGPDDPCPFAKLKNNKARAAAQKLILQLSGVGSEDAEGDGGSGGDPTKKKKKGKD